MSKWQEFFKGTTEIISKLSTCIKTQVGCVIVKGNNIISIGYNGSPSGKEHCKDHFRGWDTHSSSFKEAHHKWSIFHEAHSEENALDDLFRRGESAVGCDLYCTLQPCITCSKRIVGAGIKRVFYMEDYWESSEEAMTYLLENGVEVIKI